MRTFAALVLVVLLAVPAASSGAVGFAAVGFAAVEAPRVPVCHDGTAPLFAGGGTPVSNGVFFPGTAVRDEDQLRGEPYKIERGCNVQFVNLDHFAVANAHKIVSFDRRRNGRPLFASKLVRGPGQVIMRTKRLKPGVYEYFCAIHAGQFGILEITNGLR